MKYNQLPYIIKILLLAVVYFITARIGLLFSFVEGNVTLIWPPTGIALAVLLLGGYRLWPGVAIGAFLTSIATGAPWGFVLATLVGNTLEALAGAYILRHVEFKLAMARMRDVVSLILGAAGLSPILSATIGVAGLCLTGMAPWAEYLSIWWHWWVGDAMGVLLIAPALLTWITRSSTIATWTLSQWLEAGALVLTGVVTSLIVFSDWPSSGAVHLAFVYLPFLALLWASVRLGPVGAAGMNLVVNTIAVLGTVSGNGPFAGGDLNENLFLLWAFMGVASVTGLVTSATVAERLEAGASLVRAEQAYRTLVEQSLQGMFVLQKGRIVFANPALTQITGYSIEELLAMSPEEVIELVYPDDRARMQQALRGQMASIPVMSHQEYRFIHKNGTVRWLTPQTSVIEFHGQPAFQSAILDITERKMKEDRLRLVVEAMPTAMLTIDSHGKITLVNSQVERIFGYSRAELLDQAIELLVPMRFHARHRIYSSSFFNEFTPRSMGAGRDLFGLHRDGHEIPIEVGLTPIHTADGDFVLASIIDITERKRAEESHKRLEAQLVQSQKMEAIGRLAGGIAHDFNNILVPIIGYTDLARMSLSPDDQLYTDLLHVREAAERASGLTHQILAFSRRQVLEMRTINLNDLVKGFQQMVRHLIGEDIELQTTLHPALYPVKADIGQIEQVLLNLAVNARDAMPQGGTLTLETDNVYLDAAYLEKYGDAQTVGAYAMLAVSDTGVGMDNETQQHIFEPFFTTKEQGKGTGLGLATVMGIVKQHGGTMWVSSELGKGTRFKIYLPQVEGPVSTLSAMALEPISLHGTETILVVEDEVIVRKLVCKTLIAHGYHVIEAQSTTDGVRLASTYKGMIDLLLTDVIMPEMNGQKLYQHIAAIHTNIKVLYMSGYMDDVIAHHGVLDEGVSFLQKPFTINGLTQKVRQVLG